MSSNMRWIILSYGVSALIAVYLVSKMAIGVMDLAGFEDPLAGVIPITTLIGLLCGVGVFVGLLKHPRATDFGLDVVKEIRKVTWPSVVETRAATFVVIILVIIISFILGFFDYIFSTLTNLIYS